MANNWLVMHIRSAFFEVVCSVNASFKRLCRRQNVRLCGEKPGWVGLLDVFSVPSRPFLLSVSFGNCYGWSLRIFLFSGSTIWLTLGANCCNTLHKPKNEPSSFQLVGSFSPFMASVVEPAIPNWPGLITCPGYWSSQRRMTSFQFECYTLLLQ